MIEQHCVAASSMKVMDLMNFLKRSLGREPSSWARRCKPSDPWLHHIAWPRGPGLYPFQALLKPFSVIGKAACLECSGCEEIWDLSVKFALQESLVWYVRIFGVWARRERNWSDYIGILPRSDKGLLVYMVGQPLLNSGLLIIFLIYCGKFFL